MIRAIWFFAGMTAGTVVTWLASWFILGASAGTDVDLRRWAFSGVNVALLVGLGITWVVGLVSFLVIRAESDNAEVTQ